MVFADHAVRQTHCIYCDARFKYPDEQRMRKSPAQFPAQGFGYTGLQHFPHDAFDAGWGKGKGQGSKGKGKGKGLGKDKGKKGLKQQKGGWPSDHLQAGKSGRKGKDKGKQSGSNSRDQGGDPTFDLDELLMECERQGVNPMDKEERMKIERQLKSGPAQTFGDAQSAFQTAVRQRDHARKVCRDISVSLAKMLDQAAKKQQLLMKACEEAHAAEAKVAEEHVELGKVAREPTDHQDQELPQLGPLTPMFVWQKWWQKDPIFAEEYAEWLKTGSLGPEPKWAQSQMSCDAPGVEEGDGLGGDHQGASSHLEQMDWNPFGDPAFGSPEGGIEMHQLGMAQRVKPVMQPLPKSKGKSESYGSVSGKGPTTRHEPYESSVEQILETSETIVAECCQALRHYQETVVATGGAQASGG